MHFRTHQFSVHRKFPAIFSRQYFTSISQHAFFLCLPFFFLSLCSFFVFKLRNCDAYLILCSRNQTLSQTIQSKPYSNVLKTETFHLVSSIRSGLIVSAYGHVCSSNTTNCNVHIIRLLHKTFHGKNGSKAEEGKERAP